MSENGLAPTLPDTRPIDRLVHQTRSVLRLSWVATGLGLTVGLGLGILLAVTLTDLVVPLWPAFRLVGLILIAGPTAWVIIQGVIMPAFRRLRPGYVARRIEAHLPGIHNRLVSCIDLAQASGEHAYSPAFYRRLVTEALERIRGFRPRAVVDMLSLRRALAFAGLSAAAFLLALVLLSNRLPTAVARIFLPFADIPPASGVAFTVSPGEDAKVLRGEDIVFAVAVEKGEANDFQVELFSPTADKPVWHPLKKLDGNVWQIAVNSANIKAGFEHSFSFRVHGGGTWTRQRQVTILDRPSIAALHTVLHFPEYMGIPEPKVGPPQVADVTGPEESRVEVVVQAEGDVKEAEVQLLEPRQRRLAPKEQIERVWFEDKLPAGAAAEGTWKWEPKAHQRPAHTEPAFAGTHGHWFQGAAVGFQVQPEDHLFAFVYLVPDQKPETLMLEWHDGAGWEHRAYWGSDKIQLGRANSPSRWHVGPLPEAGRWVRLEVPAESVDLQRKSVRGMSFKLFGGQCYWSGGGAVRVREETLLPVKTFAMHPGEDNQWSGSFPLRGTGFYRVELRNELGYANKPMKEGKYVAIPDNPPQIVLERPGTDLVLSEPGKVPLVIAAFDDFGLADITLAVQRGDKGPWETRILKQFPTPQPSENLLTSLDLAPLKLKMGESIRYHAEARDRKGQAAQTQDFVIRLAADRNAADQQLAAFEKNQDPFHQKLLKLIAEQAKVRTAVEKMAIKYATVDDKIKEAQAKVKPPEVAKDPRTGRPIPMPPPKMPPLDPETEKLLQELRKELGQLARQEQQNVELGQQIAGDLAKTVAEANKLAMLPRDIAEQLQGLQQLFQERALQPLQNLSQAMQQGANPRQNVPEVKQLQQDSNRLQQELEAMAQRMKALDDAQRQMRDNLQDALAELKQEMLRQKGELTARDLEDLKKFIAALRQELEQQKGKQEDLHDATGTAPAAQLSEMEKKQAELDKQAQDVLNRTKDLQASDKMKRLKRQPTFPKAPYDPETGEKPVRPKEEDPDEPDASQKDKSAAAAADKKAKDKAEEDEESKFMPALGGPKPKIDPRFADKMRPVPKKSKDGAQSAQEKREDLQGHQEENLKDLKQANESLASDEKSLEQMLQQLQQAMSSPKSSAKQQGQPQSGQPKGEQDLLQALKSQAMQQALQMASRMRGMRQSASQAQSRANGRPMNPTTGNLQGSPPPGSPLAGELAKLDPDTRAALLKLQPQLREELLQSMREQGPEGYQEFINDYFKRLSQGKNPK